MEPLTFPHIPLSPLVLRTPFSTAPSIALRESLLSCSCFTSVSLASLAPGVRLLYNQFPYMSYNRERLRHTMCVEVRDFCSLLGEIIQFNFPTYGCDEYPLNKRVRGEPTAYTRK